MSSITNDLELYSRFNLIVCQRGNFSSHDDIQKVYIWVDFLLLSHCLQIEHDPINNTPQS